MRTYGESSPRGHGSVGRRELKQAPAILSLSPRTSQGVRTRSFASRGLFPRLGEYRYDSSDMSEASLELHIIRSGRASGLSGRWQGSTFFPASAEHRCLRLQLLQSPCARPPGRMPPQWPPGARFEVGLLLSTFKFSGLSRLRVRVAGRVCSNSTSAITHRLLSSFLNDQTSSNLVY